MLQGFDHPIFRWTTFPQMGTSRVEQKSPARRSCQENFVGNGKSAKAFPQQSYAESVWTVPHRAVPHTPLASFHFRIAGTSDLQNRTLGRQRLGGASLSHLPSSKRQKTSSSDEKAGADGSRSSTAGHYNCASRTRHQPNLPGGEEKDQRVTCINLPMRYHNRSPGCQQLNLPGGNRTCADHEAVISVFEVVSS